MPRGFKNNNNLWVLILLLLIGGLTGSAIGNALGLWLPWLNPTTTIGLKTFVLDMHFFSLTFGFTFILNPLTAVGFLLGYFIYRRV